MGPIANMVAKYPTSLKIFPRALLNKALFFILLMFLMGMEVFDEIIVCNRNPIVLS